MKKITNTDFLIAKIKGFKEKSNKLCTNLPLDIKVFFHYIEEGRLFFEETDVCLFLLVDERRYYTLFYLAEEKMANIILDADKKVLINENQIIKNKDVAINQMYIDNGFEVTSVNEQYHINISNEKDQILKNYEEAMKLLSEKGFVVSNINRNEIEQVKNLWERCLNDTDIPYDHYGSGEIITIKCKNILIGAAWYKSVGSRSEWRHIVVKEDFRRQGIANCLIFYYLNSLVQNGIKSSLTWINQNNSTSVAFHENVGFVKNNRISVQYVLE